MQSLRSTVKTNSRRALRGKYGRAMVMMLLLFGIGIMFMLINSIISLALNLPIFINLEGKFTPSLIHDINLSIPLLVNNIVMTVLGFLVMIPLIYGVSGWFYRMVGDENCEISSAFSFFESMGQMARSWAAEINVLIRKIFYFVIFTLPGFAVIMLSAEFISPYIHGYDIGRQLVAVSLSVLGALLMTVGYVFFVIVCKKYTMVRYLMADDRNLSIIEAVRLSRKITEGRRGELFVFDLSYLLWFALCLTIIPALYVIPYYMTGRALYSRVMIASYLSNHANDSSVPDFDGDMTETQSDSPEI